MESFFSSMKTERIGRKTYRTRNHAKADVFDYIERFYNPTRRHSTLGYRFHRLRAASAVSLTSCPCDRQQLNLQSMDRRPKSVRLKRASSIAGTKHPKAQKPRTVWSGAFVLVLVAGTGFEPVTFRL